MTEAEQKEIQDLKQTDREVRQHEAAHTKAAGGLAGPVQYDYTTGPDGNRYAVGGEVSIDVSKVPNDPEATIQKADRIRRAALAPANPSGQDRAVAASASKMAAAARSELTQERLDEASGIDEDTVAEGAAPIDGDVSEKSTSPKTIDPDDLLGNLINIEG